MPFKLATYEEDRNLVYVGMTRHRTSLQVFSSKLDFWRNEIFARRLSQTREKLSSLDYLSQDEARLRLTPPQRLQETLDTLGHKLESWGYTTRQHWDRLCMHFTGTQVIRLDRVPELFDTVDEIQRTRSIEMLARHGASQEQASAKESKSCVSK